MVVLEKTEERVQIDLIRKFQSFFNEESFNEMLNVQEIR